MNVEEKLSSISSIDITGFLSTSIGCLAFPMARQRQVTATGRQLRLRPFRGFRIEHTNVFSLADYVSSPGIDISECLQPAEATERGKTLPKSTRSIQ